MNYKTYIYAITALLSVFALSGVNFEPIIRKNKKIEATILIVLLALALSYSTTNFITDFINLSAIIKK